MKAFIIDLEKCNGCYNCQLACKDEHCGNDWAPYAAPQPDTGHFWLKVHETTHGQVPKVRVEYRPRLCAHCDNAPCIEAAPDAVYRREDGLVIIDPVKARGNRALVDACPFGAIYWNEELRLAQKCTGCAHLVDRGETPHCVDLCAVGALRFGEEEEFADEIAHAETMVDAGFGPHVYYLNAPKLFMGGEVWDPAVDEIVRGANVSLTDDAGNRMTTLSDGFGDFWFKRLDPASYHLLIEAEGYRPVTRDVLLEKSLNLGDFPLEK